MLSWSERTGETASRAVTNSSTDLEMFSQFLNGRAPAQLMAYLVSRHCLNGQLPYGTVA